MSGRNGKVSLADVRKRPVLRAQLKTSVSGIISQGLVHFLQPVEGMDEVEGWEKKGLSEIGKRNSPGILSRGKVKPRKGLRTRRVGSVK